MSQGRREIYAYSISSCLVLCTLFPSMRKSIFPDDVGGVWTVSHPVSADVTRASLHFPGQNL